MKSIKITYTILGIFFACIFIYYVLHKQYLIQSSTKKTQIGSTGKEDLELSVSIKELPVTIIEHEEFEQKTAETKKTPSFVKTTADKTKKDIRKRKHTTYTHLEQDVAENKQKKNNQSDFSKKHIIVTNNITKEMLMYHHWTGNHAPTTFIVSVDGVPLHAGQSTAVFYNDHNEIVIRYDYSFLKGYKTGSREIYFEPNKTENQTYSLTFSWQHPMHLLLENAETKKGVVVDFNTFLENN